MRRYSVLIICVSLLFGCSSDRKKAREYREQGDWINSEEYYRRAVKKDPDDARLHNELGYVCEKRGFFDLARDEYREAVRLDPYFVEAHNNVGTVLYRMGMMRDAFEAFKKLLEIDPNNANAYNNLGLISHIYFKNKEQALGYYKEAIRLNPDSSTFHHNLSQLYSSMGKQKEAKEEAERALLLKRHEKK